MAAETIIQAKKRKTVDPEEQPAKRRKEHNSISSNDDYEEVAGKIKRIFMKNFMCFDAKEVVFNPRINFIVGANGSGKSAIVAALTIGLGARTSAACRYSSTKEFIKIGKHSALIEITISNDGNSAYKYDIYGSTITVVRIIGINRGYKIKNWRGEVVSTNEDDLDDIFKSLNIHVDNPISVLNEDIARSFWSSSGPEEKYRILMKATKLEMLENYCKSANSTVCEADQLESIESYDKNIFEERRKEITLILQEKFTSVLSLRNYIGRIMIDHSEKLLNVEVSSANALYISCGERTYSTVAFIIATWAIVGFPFYFLDSFDIFMDKIHRRIIMDVLLDHAKSNPLHQFVFLTCLDIPANDIQANNLITIHRL